MLNAVTQETGKQVARPLKVLVPLIKEQKQLGDEAARAARGWAPSVGSEG